MLISVVFLKKLSEIYIDNSLINAYMNHITVNILIQQCRNIIHTVKTKNATTAKIIQLFSKRRLQG